MPPITEGLDRLSTSDPCVCISELSTGQALLSASHLADPIRAREGQRHVGVTEEGGGWCGPAGNLQHPIVKAPGGGDCNPRHSFAKAASRGGDCEPHARISHSTEGADITPQRAIEGNADGTDIARHVDRVQTRHGDVKDLPNAALLEAKGMFPAKAVSPAYLCSVRVRDDIYPRLTDCSADANAREDNLVTHSCNTLGIGCLQGGYVAQCDARTIDAHVQLPSRVRYLSLLLSGR